ncbi:MAG: phosphatase PAP2 family protein [Chloroflexota bacterium]
MLTFWHFIFPIMLYFWGVWNLKLNDWVSKRGVYHSTMIPADEAIPFIPAFAYFYFSSYALSVLAYVWLFNDADFSKTMIGYLILVLVAFGCYIFFPCKVERREDLAVTSLSTQMIVRFQQLSKPYNSFPSMHCGFSLFSALAIIQFSGHPFAPLLLIWFVLIMLSTLFTKQHHLIDVVAGVLLASVTAFGIQFIK